MPATGSGISAAPHTTRVPALDALRGVGVCGILLTNLCQLAFLVPTGPDYGYLSIPYVLELTAHQRFSPILSFVFGVSFALFLDSAARRTDRPKLVMARRLGILLGFGLVHSAAHPGEALSLYAVVGFVLVLPATWLPRFLVVVLGTAVSVAGLVVVAGGTILSAGLLLLGYAVGCYGLAPRLRDLRRWGTQIAGLFACSVVVAAVACAWQASEIMFSGYSTSSAVAGVAVAMAYATGFLLLLRTSAGPALSAVFEPMGRMALTNYLSATVVVLGVIPVLGLDGSRQWDVAVAVALVIVIAQAVFSRWWLRSHRYGPLEWCVRCVTWMRPVPNSISPTSAAAAR